MKEMKWEYKIEELAHHKGVPKTIEKLEDKGWELVSYTTASKYQSVGGFGGPPIINHYLLFRRER